MEYTLFARFSTQGTSIMATMTGKAFTHVLETCGIVDAPAPKDAAASGEAPAAPQRYLDLPVAELVEHAVRNREGQLAANGTLVVKTGEFTGRSPKDRFIVDTPDDHDKIAWGKVNVPISQESYERVRDGVAAYLSQHDTYVTCGLAGADRNYARTFFVACERASQALFIKQMLVRPRVREHVTFDHPDFRVMVAPGYRCDPKRDGVHSAAAVLINFQERMIVIAGTCFSGEIKKSIFSVMNYLLPLEDNVLPMHCSASMDPISHETAVFFGLSGTGKTTLSANPTRLLIGDDEHGWSNVGVFDIEGGCYAKCDGLDEYREPEIYQAIHFGAMAENVVLDERREPDYADTSITRNTRVAYPIEHIANAWVRGVTPNPSVVIMLTCDAFGVLPPIARLTPEGAMYHFVTGFTAKVPGTEQGVTEPTPTFSAMFGEPFMPLDPMVYAQMLGDRLRLGSTRAYLVNTGWIGGDYDHGHRIDLAYTRALVARALDGTIEEADFTHDEIFNLDIPVTCHGVPDAILVPRTYWKSSSLYDSAAHELACLFKQNFEKRYAHLPEEIRAAGPRG